MLGNFRGGRGGMRGRGGFRGGRGRQSGMRRGGRGQTRGGATSAVRNKSKQKDPCSVYVSFINPIEAVCASELLDVARSAAASVKFGRHCYLTFATESEASATLSKAGDVEFGGQKPYVDHAYKSQSAKAAGKRGAEVNVQSSPTKKMKSNTGGSVEKEGDEKMETAEEEEEEEEEEAAEVEDGGKEGETGENYAEEAA